jgi:flagellar basal-body rod modification protein FlgD
MNVTQTTSIAPATDNSANYATRIPNQKLGQDEFIKILVTQLRSQDPLNPQKDTEFIGQMAQFNALESTKSMQAEIQSLRANALIGHKVEINDGELNVVGEVTSVDNIKGELRIIVNGAPYSLRDVVRVEHNAPASAELQTEPLSRKPTSPE